MGHIQREDLYGVGTYMEWGSEDTYKDGIYTKRGHIRRGDIHCGGWSLASEFFMTFCLFLLTSFSRVGQLHRKILIPPAKLLIADGYSSLAG